MDADQVSLGHKLASPAYTPGKRDLDGLLAGLLAGVLPSGAVTTALLRAGAQARQRVRARLESERGPGRAELVRLLGRLSDGDDPAQRAVLLELVGDADPRAARQAIQAAGKLVAHAEEVGARLIALWPIRPLPADRRALAEALGKLGAAAARPLLLEARVAQPEGTPLRTILERALLMIERSHGPDHEAAPASVRLDLPLPPGTRVSLRCRAGLGAILRDELRARGLVPQGAPIEVLEPEPRPSPTGELARVELTWSGPLLPLLGARTFLALALPLSLSGPGPGPASRAPRHDDERIEQVAAALAAPQNQALFQALGARSAQPLRFRIELPGSGPRRALIWGLAQEVARRCPLLRNDPKDSPWELGIVETPGQPLRLELRAQRLEDPRFTYRVAAVPASSQPTLAAALARLLDPSPADVVWDPFVGAGGELIEVARLGRCRRLHGTDLSADAIEAARANVAAAGLEGVKLELGDALQVRPAGVTCIVTNPPMGRRVQRGEVTELLARFVRHAAAVLPPGGRLAWLDPQPQRHEPLLRELGLRPLVLRAVDMNGFWAQLELWQK